MVKTNNFTYLKLLKHIRLSSSYSNKLRLRNYYQHEIKSQSKSESLWFSLSIWHVYNDPLTQTTNSRLLPSGDSSCTYVPVKYRWTKADFPLDRLPTMPCKVKSKMLWLFLTGVHDRYKPQADVDLKDRDGDLTRNSQREDLALSTLCPKLSTSLSTLICWVRPRNVVCLFITANKKTLHQELYYHKLNICLINSRKREIR